MSKQYIVTINNLGSDFEIGTRIPNKITLNGEIIKGLSLKGNTLTIANLAGDVVSTDFNLTTTAIVSGTFPVALGGTGLNTYASGDILYANATNSLGKLSGNIFGVNKFLTQIGTGTLPNAPVWSTIALSDLPTVDATKGGTGLTSATLGQLIYASEANTWNVLAGNTTTSPKYLKQTGTGKVSAAPVWASLTPKDLTDAYLLTTGTAPAYVVTPTVPWTGYATGSNFICCFHAAYTLTTTNITINVSGLGAREVRVWNGTSGYVNLNTKGIGGVNYIVRLVYHSGGYFVVV